MKFRGSFLKQDEVTYNHGKILNIYIVYEIDRIYIKTSPTLVNCLFGAVSLTKNADNVKQKYSGYGIGFDRGSVNSFCDGFGRNVIIFGADMCSSFHVDNKRKDISILRKGLTQRLGEHSLTAEKMYLINFTENKEKYCLSLHYNGAIRYLLINRTQII